MTLATQVAAAVDSVLIGKVEQALVEAAIAIQNEGTAVANHAARTQYARNVLQSSSSAARVFTEGVASQGLDNTATDAAIRAAVSSLWNAYAGGIP